MSKLKLSLFLGVLSGFLITMAVYAFEDPIGALAQRFEEEKAILQDIQYSKKQIENKERQQLTKLCEIMKEKASVMLLESESEYSIEDRQKLLNRSQLDCTKWYTNTLLDVYTEPSDLSYVFLKSQGTYVTQSFKDHFSRNGYMAVDIGTGGEELEMYAPSFMPEKGKDIEMEYTVKLVHNYDTMGQTVELHFKYDGVNYNWAVGHLSEFKVKEGQKVKTGQVIGISGGCLTKLKEGEKSTGCHSHTEFRVEGIAVPYPTWAYTVHYGENGKPASVQEVCYKKDVGEDQQQYVRIASQVSGNDINFLALLNAENGKFTPDRIHNDGHGVGFCGIDDRWHKDIIDDPNFKDPEWQIKKCYELWTTGTKFYGNIESQLDKFVCP